MFLGADTIRPLLRRLVPEAEVISRPRFSTLTYSRHQEDHAPAAPQRRRRLLGRRRLRAGRADAPPARRRRGGAWARFARAPAMPRSRCTRPARSTIWSRPTPSAWASTWTSTMSPSPRWRKFDGRGPRRLTAAGDRADRRPRRPPHERRQLRHHRRGRPARPRAGRGGREPPLRSADRAVLAQRRSRLPLARRPAAQPRARGRRRPA